MRNAAEEAAPEKQATAMLCLSAIIEGVRPVLDATHEWTSMLDRLLQVCMTGVVAVDVYSLLERHSQSESELVRVRTMQLVRELVYVMAGSIDHAGLLPAIVRGLSDTTELVVVSAVCAIGTVFADQDEAPEGLAEEHVDTMAPALITHLTADNAEVRCGVLVVSPLMSGSHGGLAVTLKCHARLGHFDKACWRSYGAVCIATRRPPCGHLA